MVIIPSQKRSFINILLIIMFMLSVAAVATLIILYSYVVNFNKSILSAENEIKSIEIANTEFKEKLFNVLASDNLENLANEFNLVKEKSPQYLEINRSQWQLGLNF